MKSERRHELQHNDLADWFVSTYESMTPYKNSILGVLLLAIVAVIAIMFWRSHTAGQAEEAWNKIEIPQAIVQCPMFQSPMFQIQPVYVFPAYVQIVEEASKQYGGTPAGEWADILAADSYLVAGVDKLMAPGQKEAANEFLKRALVSYDKALATAAAPLARERAMFGKARALESSGSLKDAADAYDNLNKEFPKGTYKAIADQRLEQLRLPDAEEFYKAVADYVPAAKSEKEKTTEKHAEGPKGKLDKLAPLSENPPGETPSPKSTASPTAVKPSKSSAAPTLPEAPKTPLGPAIPQITPPATTPVAPKAEAPKPEAAKSSAAAPAAPKSPAAPAASSAAPARAGK